MNLPAYVAAGLAPAASIGLWTGTAALLGVVRLPPTPALTTSLVLVVVGLAVWLRWRRDQSSPGGPKVARAWSRYLPAVPGHSLAVLGGVVAAAGIAAATWGIGWPSLDAVSQFSDMTWHGYVVTLLSHGTPADPFTLVPLTPSGGISHPYPWGAHLVASLIGQLTGVEVPVALKSLQLAVLGVGYPLGCSALAYGLARGARQRIVAATVTPVLAVSIGVFPWQADQWWAYPCAVGLIPGIAAAFLHLAKPAAESSLRQERARWIPAAVGLAGITAVHPSATLALIVLIGLTLMLGGGRFNEYRPRHRAFLRLTAGSIAGVGLSAFLIGRSLTLAGNVVETHRRGSQPLGLALKSILVQNSAGAQRLVVALFVVASIVALVRRVALGPVAFAGVFTILAAGSSASVGPLSLLGGPWFHEGLRLLALAACVLPVIVGTQFAWGLDRAVGRLERQRHVSRPVLAAVSLAVAVLVAAPQIAANAGWVRARYLPAPLGSRDLAAFAWLHSHSANHPVMNPVTFGHTGWMYALDGVDPIFPHTTQAQLIPERGFLALCLNTIDDDPRVRTLVDADRILYVFIPAPGKPADRGNTLAADSPGLVGLGSNPSFLAVGRYGGDVIYRVLPPPRRVLAHTVARPCALTQFPTWWTYRQGLYAVILKEATQVGPTS